MTMLDEESNGRSIPTEMKPLRTPSAISSFVKGRQYHFFARGVRSKGLPWMTTRDGMPPNDDPTKTRTAAMTNWPADDESFSFGRTLVFAVPEVSLSFRETVIVHPLRFGQTNDCPLSLDNLVFKSSPPLPIPRPPKTTLAESPIFCKVSKIVNGKAGFFLACASKALPDAPTIRIVLCGLTSSDIGRESMHSSPKKKIVPFDETAPKKALSPYMGPLAATSLLMKGVEKAAKPAKDPDDIRSRPSSSLDDQGNRLTLDSFSLYSTQRSLGVLLFTDLPTQLTRKKAVPFRYARPNSVQ
mmetsp:Transcript_6285/g.14831  ORF Transcript_6285/g.14831 Transcript_6285/m.14831 type:complete len:299 (-) Transcript_6285:3556-4452(-)